MRGRPWLRRVVPVAVLAIVIAAVSSAIALSAFGGSEPSAPPAAPLDQAIESALTAPRVPGITGSATLTGELLPGASALGSLGSSLTAATGHFWATGDGSGRIDVQSPLGAVQIGWTKGAVTIYEPSSNTAYELQLPTSSGSHKQPTLDQVDQGITEVSQEFTITGPTPGVVAHQPAYSVSLVPKDDSSLVGEVDLAWDATYGIPLHIAITPKGASTPAIDVALSDLTVGPVDQTQVTLNVPSTAKVVQLSAPAQSGAGANQTHVSFDPVAPATLDGKKLSSKRTVGGTALLTYGTGLSAIVVDERPADAGGPDPTSGLAAILPHVTIGPVSAQELETTLGTVVSFDRNGISFVVGASLPKSAVESAAAALA